MIITEVVRKKVEEEMQALFEKQYKNVATRVTIIGDYLGEDRININIQFTPIALTDLGMKLEQEAQ